MGVNSLIAPNPPDHLVSAIQDQITCSAMTGAKWYACPDHRCSSSHFPLCSGLSYRYNLGTWIITDIDMSIVGVVVCACLCSSVRLDLRHDWKHVAHPCGLNQDVVKFWKRVVYLLRNKKFEVAMKKIRVMNPPLSIFASLIEYE